jgi:crossover junction endodeoxyribonuclease RusA
MRLRDRVVLRKEGREFREAVVGMVDDLRKAGLVGDTLTGPVFVDIVAVVPDHRRRDIDNILKALLDALGHAGIYADDTQITKLAAEKRPPEGKSGGWVDVTIVALDEPEP